MARIVLLIVKVLNILLSKIFKKLFKSSGDNITFYPLNSSFSYERISIGKDVFIGPGARFSSITEINIGNKVMFGPNVTIMGGDHNTSVLGKYMYDVEEKLPENDLPVIIESDVWIGCNSIILKGVTVAEGTIIGAGSVVTKSTEPYSIYGGNPAKLIKNRFSLENLERHKSILSKQDA